ncbi:D-alanine--D-alanine ligase [Lyngbya confervoides]|uniref:ATP-grasp domain-containing protein n=1 Tax=Lyngbya confervoides BDU141951 TaxID=1574623 RepID=A0ABD4SZQ2_9CYAN|nr:D-alanine--D-alanine ligase [Lyngbya confervoides]MCM1981630.1 hypothetical protein [Lyngbya confervoides BDU141951]
MQVGLLFETATDLLSQPGAVAQTHYHWRENEEVAALTQALTTLGHQVESIGSVTQLLERYQAGLRPDLVWNLSVRAQSRSRTAIAPALLEQLQIPYTGGDAASKSLVLNKDWLKPLLHWCGILTPEWQRFGLGVVPMALPPWPQSVLKPTCEGYSLGLSRFDNTAGLTVFQQQVDHLHQQFHVPVLCEAFIPGREITIGLVGGDAQCQVLGGVETLTAEAQPLQDQMLDLPRKRQGGDQKVRVDLSQAPFQDAKAAAIALFKLLHPLDYATFDFRVTATGSAYLLDVNADATLHPQRSLAKIAAAEGLSYGQLIAAILETVQQRWPATGRTSMGHSPCPELDPPAAQRSL